ncbi:MAG: hypothetical protein MAG451_01947 [Anaerolineales bacterium]|nr:hypothetical protein [Anaerolineales bacterium]
MRRLIRFANLIAVDDGRHPRQRGQQEIGHLDPSRVLLQKRGGPTRYPKAFPEYFAIRCQMLQNVIPLLLRGELECQLIVIAQEVDPGGPEWETLVRALQGRPNIVRVGIEDGRPEVIHQVEIVGKFGFQLSLSVVLQDGAQGLAGLDEKNRSGRDLFDHQVEGLQNIVQPPV